MSTFVTIRTNNSPKPDEILNYLASRGEQIVVTSIEFPSVKFGTHLKALRGIEVNQEQNGLEVRVCSFASTADYQLFAKTINALKDLTGCDAFEEDDDECKIENPLEHYNDKWIQQQHESNLAVTKALIKHEGCPVVFYGLFFHFCIGPKLLEDFNISLTEDYKKKKMDKLLDYLCSIQWHFANLKDTSMDMVIPAPNGDGNPLSISAIMIKDGQVEPFDYISEASLFVMLDLDNESTKPILIPFKELWKILPMDVFRSIDEWQYERTGELTVDMVYEMMEAAVCYQPDDIYQKPTYPGNGFDDRQNTFILMWNPAISSVTMENHVNDIPNLLTEEFNWSVYEYEKAKMGDRFVMIRCGEGRTGIVMSGVFSSNPYEAEDWSGKGRKVFYMDMTPNFIADPERLENFITTEDLQKAIPDFEWSGGHSGRILTVAQAKKLEEILGGYLVQFCNNVDGEIVNGFSLPQDYNSASRITNA
jgi:hypothetical protein